MTCVVGLISKRKIYIGADSAAGSGTDIIIRKDRKVFTNRDFIIGFTSSFRMGQILRYHWNPPEFPEHYTGSESDMIDFYIHTSIIDSIMKCLYTHEYASKKDNELTGGCFLLGYKYKLYTVYDDFQVSESIEDYAAIGCGEDYALGALHVMSHHLYDSPIEKVTLALEAAAKFSSGVAAPFHIVEK